MFGGAEGVIILIVAAIVLLFGSAKIPKFARSLGQAQKEFKTGLSEGTDEDSDSDGDDTKK